MRKGGKGERGRVTSNIIISQVKPETLRHCAIHKDPGVFTRLIGVCCEPREVADSCYRTGEKRDEERGERGERGGEGEGN